ncbi:Rho guanine nucleotide exchange factor 19 [Manis javanica]|nr:Rho guanine nucleotide exchange factor 19 [Manis javanica]
MTQTSLCKFKLCSRPAVNVDTLWNRIYFTGSFSVKRCTVRSTSQHVVFFLDLIAWLVPDVPAALVPKSPQGPQEPWAVSEAGWSSLAEGLMNQTLCLGGSSSSQLGRERASPAGAAKQHQQRAQAERPRLLWPPSPGVPDTKITSGAMRPSRAGSWPHCPSAQPPTLEGPWSPQYPQPQRRASQGSEKKSAWRKMRVYQREEASGSREAHAVFLEPGQAAGRALNTEEPGPLEPAGPTRAGLEGPERRRFSASELMTRLHSSLRLARNSAARALTPGSGTGAAQEGKASGRESRSVEMRVDCMALPVSVDPSGSHGGWPEARPDTREEPALGSRSASERRQSRFLLNSVLYQEYSDVASARELRRQQREEEGPGDEVEGAEEGPGPPRANLSPSSSFRAQRSARGSTFSLWQDIPDVRGSGVLATLSLRDCKLQEAKFELITSEASYIHSLSVAVGHFLGSAELNGCLGVQDKQWLFSKLPEVKSTSERFLQDLEQRLEADVLRFSVCDVVLHHCPAFRRVYLPYVTNQAYQERTYQRLLLQNPKFPGVLARLEESPVCQRLPLTSFLILPFQRITRLKMLVENILRRTAQGSEHEDMATKAFNALKELVQECNASVQSMKRTEELIHLSKKIHFEGKIFPLISQARWLVRQGELVELAPLPAAPPAKLKLSSKAVYLHLFNDCLLLSRRKELGKFAVFVHATMAELQVKDLSLKLQGIPGHVFLLQLLPGQHAKHQFLLRARTESEKRRWISAMCPSSPQEDKEVISEGEDRPQVQCVRTYKALQPDELTLEKTDILAVRTWTSDGWLEGVRLADGEKGWVPQAYVEEISSLSARLRNLRENKRVTSATSKLGEPPV